MKHPFFSKYFLIACFMGMVGCAKKTGPATVSKSTDTYALKTINVHNMELAIVNEVNRYRHTKNLPPLAIHEDLNFEAGKHSRNMASHATPFGHTGFNTRIQSIYKRMGNGQAAAENVAYGKMDAKELVQQWINSSSHRKNLEGKFNLTGVGLAKTSTGTVYYTQIFIRR